MKKKIRWVTLVFPVFLVIIIIDALFIKFKSSIPSGYRGCVLSGGYDRDYVCVWKYTLPSVTSCNDSGCIKSMKIDKKFKDCERKGGTINPPINISPGGSIGKEISDEICSLSFFNPGFSIPKDYEGCSKLKSTSFGSIGVYNRSCELNIEDNSVYDNQDNKNTIKDLLDECKNKGGKTTTRQYQIQTLYPPDQEIGQVILIYKMSDVNGCDLVFNTYLPNLK